MTAEHAPHDPTPEHKRATEPIVPFFQGQPQGDAVLIVNSCARGAATPESDLAVPGETRRT